MSHSARPNGRPPAAAAFPASILLLGVTLGNAMFAAYPPTRAFAAAPLGMFGVIAVSAAVGPVAALFRADLLAAATTILPVQLLAGTCYALWTLLALRLAEQQEWMPIVSLPVVQRLLLLTMVSSAIALVSVAVGTAIWPRARWSPNGS